MARPAGRLFLSCGLLAICSLALLRAASDPEEEAAGFSAQTQSTSRPADDGPFLRRSRVRERVPIVRRVDGEVDDGDQRPQTRDPKAIIALLVSKDEMTYQSAWRAFDELGADAIPALEDAMAGSDPMLAELAAILRFNLCDQSESSYQRLLGVTVRALGGKEYAGLASQILGEKAATCLEELVHELDSGSTAARGWAALAIGFGRVAPTEAARILEQRVADIEPSVRACVLRALSFVDKEDSRQGLFLAALADPAVEVRVEGIHCVAAHHMDAVAERLIENLATLDPSPEVRKSARMVCESGVPQK